MRNAHPSLETNTKLITISYHTLCFYIWTELSETYYFALIFYSEAFWSAIYTWEASWQRVYTGFSTCIYSTHTWCYNYKAALNYSHKLFSVGLLSKTGLMNSAGKVSVLRNRNCSATRGLHPCDIIIKHSIYYVLSLDRNRSSSAPGAWKAEAQSI